MNKPCTFSSSGLQFKGTPVEQAQCLLRQVRVGGNVNDTPATLPNALSIRIGKPVEFNRSQLDTYLAFKGIAARDIGGALEGSVSTTPGGKKALYFVIHDTSDEVSTVAFPPNINEATWSPNNLAKRNIKSAHVFINQLGQSATGHNYSVGWRATKREAGLNGALKGLFLHHELVQPRIKGSFSFHAVGPSPGFTAVTIEQLALCYIAASLRKGAWMIPAFHCVLDLGISDGHDDPQNFDLFQWSGAIEKVLGEILTPVHATVPVAASVSPVPALAMSAPLAATGATTINIETVRSDLSDGKRKVKVMRIKGTKPVFFKAKMAIDADGAARAYHPDDVPEALDRLKNATSGSKKFIQGKKKNGVIGKGPRPGFFVSETAFKSR